VADLNLLGVTNVLSDGLAEAQQGPMEDLGDAALGKVEGTAYLPQRKTPRSSRTS
jgi:hypothetical protein